MIKFHTVANALDSMGMTIRAQQGEYRIAFKGVTLIMAKNQSFHKSPEDTAYYTNDLRDALDTAIYMRRFFDTYNK